MIGLLADAAPRTTNCETSWRARPHFMHMEPQLRMLQLLQYICCCIHNKHTAQQWVRTF